jgi:hypothetical protein
LVAVVGGVAGTIVSVAGAADHVQAVAAGVDD